MCFNDDGKDPSITNHNTYNKALWQWHFELLRLCRQHRRIIANCLQQRNYFRQNLLTRTTATKQVAYWNSIVQQMKYQQLLFCLCIYSISILLTMGCQWCSKAQNLIAKISNIQWRMLSEKAESGTAFFRKFSIDLSSAARCAMHWRPASWRIPYKQC